MIIWKKKLIECCKCHKRYSFDDNLFYHLKDYILVCPNCNLMHRVDIQLLGKEYEGLKRVDKLNLTAIDIGSAAVNRGYAQNPYTVVDTNNPANANGKITSIELYVNTALTGCQVAIFYVVSGTNLSTRSTVAIGNVGVGYNIFTDGISLDVQEGDFIGIYFSTGRLDRDDTGLGYYAKSGDNIPCTNAAFSFYGQNTISLYGTGETVEVEVANAIMMGMNF